jgi:hypothetical protein
MFHFAAHLNDRLIFRDFPQFSRLSKFLQEISTLKFGVTIGEESRREGGISGNFKMIKIDTPAAYFKQLKVAPDCGTVLMVDWLFHSDTTEEDAHRCAISTRQFLGAVAAFSLLMCVAIRDCNCWCTDAKFEHTVWRIHRHRLMRFPVYYCYRAPPGEGAAREQGLLRHECYHRNQRVGRQQGSVDVKFISCMAMCCGPVLQDKRWYSGRLCRLSPTSPVPLLRSVCNCLPPSCG